MGGEVAAAADHDHGGIQVQFGQACLELAHRDVHGAGNYAGSDFDVLANVKDSGLGAALVRFSDADFSHAGVLSGS